MKDALQTFFSRLSGLWKGIADNAKGLPKPWKLGLMIGVPLVLVLAMSAWIVPRALSVKAAPEPEETPTVLAAEETPAPTPTPTPTPTPEPTPEPAVVLQLRATSSELDMLVSVLNETGEPVQGVEFPLVFTYPDGSTHNEVTDLDGQLYRSGLEEGAYSVSLSPIEGYALPEPLSFKVSPKLAYEPIRDVREQTEVKAVSELPVAEVKQAQVDTPAPAPAVESISTEALAAQAAAAPAPQVEGEILIEAPEPEPAPAPAPAPTPTPEPTYIYPEPYYEYPDPYYEYSYEVGPGGNLLLSDGSESDVYPVEEGGHISYGLRRIVSLMRIGADGSVTEIDAIPEEPEEGVQYVEEESSEVVFLLNEDGSAVDGYRITATLITPDPVLITPDPILVTPEPVAQPTPAPTPTPAPETITLVETPVGWRTEADGTCFYDLNGNRVTGLKEIDGKLYYFNDYGVKASSLGIDVSYFNGPIDFNQVKAHGIDFVIVRVAGRTWGSGVLFEDGNSYKLMENGGRYLQEARAAGLKIGAYVWSSAVNTNEAVEEASLALQILGGMQLDFPLYIDMEYSGNYPYGRADRLSMQQRTEIVQAFCPTVSNGGYSPGVYAGQNYWQEAIAYGFCAGAGYNIWMASYTNNMQLPTAFPWGYNIWQCSSSAHIRGIGGDCDLNVIF